MLHYLDLSANQIDALPGNFGYLSTQDFFYLLLFFFSLSNPLSPYS